MNIYVYMHMYMGISILVWLLAKGMLDPQELLLCFFHCYPPAPHSGSSGSQVLTSNTLIASIGRS